MFWGMGPWMNFFFKHLGDTVRSLTWLVYRDLKHIVGAQWIFVCVCVWVMLAAFWSSPRCKQAHPTIVWNVPCAQDMGELSHSFTKYLCSPRLPMHTAAIVPFHPVPCHQYLKYIYLFVYMCLSVCVCIVCACAHRAQKQVWAPLELELTAFVSLFLSAGSPTWVLRKSHRSS